MNSIDILRQNEPLWGKWSLGDSIGSGVQSQVFLVRDSEGERRALKVITMGRSREQQEAVREQVGFTDRMGQLDGVVSCLRTGEFGENNDKVAVMLMPLLTPLSDTLMEREEDMSAAEVLGIARDLCGALVECQSSGVIHRDIKPANVFSDENGKYYLGDLGVARSLEHTMLATRKGTPAYMSPEIASGRPCSFSSDIYSLGVMLYQLLNAGRLPLLGRDARYTEIEEAVTRRLNGEALPLPENAQDRLGQLVCEMCSPEPGKRPSAQQCAEELEKLSRILERDGALPPARLRLSRKTKLELLTCGASALVLAVILLVVLLGTAEADFPAASSPAANAFSSGGAAGDESWLYLGSNEAGNAAYRIDRNTGDTEEIYDGSITHLNLCGDRIFFTANHTIESAVRLEDGSVTAYMRSGVRSMASDGSDEKILCRCDTSAVVEYDGWLYHCVSDIDRSDKSKIAASSRIMRVTTDGSSEETLCTLNGIYADGIYVYRGRIYLSCTDYTDPDGASACVISTALDGTDMTEVINGGVSSLDFSGEYICWTESDLSGSPIMKKPINGTGAAQVVSDMQAAAFCVYEDQFILSTVERFDSADDEDSGVFICDADGKPVRRLLDQCASRMELAGDILIAETADGRLLAVNIDSGEQLPLEDFRFELY